MLAQLFNGAGFLWSYNVTVGARELDHFEMARQLQGTVFFLPGTLAAFQSETEKRGKFGEELRRLGDKRPSAASALFFSTTTFKVR